MGHANTGRDNGFGPKAKVGASLKNTGSRRKGRVICSTTHQGYEESIDVSTIQGVSKKAVMEGRTPAMMKRNVEMESRTDLSS